MYVINLDLLYLTIFASYISHVQNNQCCGDVFGSRGSRGEDLEKKLNKMREKLTGRGINGMDDSVDARAASYISSVRERFKLDHCERVTTTVVSLDHEDVDR